MKAGGVLRGFGVDHRPCPRLRGRDSQGPRRATPRPMCRSRPEDERAVAATAQKCIDRLKVSRIQHSPEPDDVGPQGALRPFVSQSSQVGACDRGSLPRHERARCRRPSTWSGKAAVDLDDALGPGTLVKSVTFWVTRRK